MRPLHSAFSQARNQGARCELSKTNIPISPPKPCDTLQYMRVAYVEKLSLETAHFQMHVQYVQNVSCNVTEPLCK